MNTLQKKVYRVTDPNRMFAQGDVLLIPWKGSAPANATPEPVDPAHGRVLAYGEATGSAHALDPAGCVVLAPTEETPRLLTIDAPGAVEAAEAILRHAKHPAIAIPPKTVWEVRRQVEEIEGTAQFMAD